jgi:hypothetical protein
MIVHPFFQLYLAMLQACVEPRVRSPEEWRATFYLIQGGKAA